MYNNIKRKSEEILYLINILQILSLFSPNI